MAWWQDTYKYAMLVRAKAILEIGLLVLLLIMPGGLLPVQAGDQEAGRPLVPKFLSRILQPLPNNKAAYLVVTAGGASTDVLVIAAPSVPPTALVKALRSALAATRLRSQPVEWSAPTDRILWVAAHASLRRGHIGAWQATNSVPIGALCDGLRQGGFEPYPALHLPVAAFCGGLPRPFADFNGDRWYDLEEMRPRAFLQVSSAVDPTDLLPLLLPLVLIPAIGLVAQAAAVRWARLRDPMRQGRKRFDGISNVPTGAAWVGWMMFPLGNLTQLHEVNDVWLGRAGDGDLFSAWFVLILMVVGLTFWNGQRVALRLYGPVGAIPMSAMSTQERSLHEREALWSAAIPVLMAGTVLALLIGGFAWLPARLASAAVRLIPLILMIPLGLYFSNKRKAFTTLVPDAALTDTLRYIVTAPGLPPGEVTVEQGARAKTYAFLRGERGGQIVVSQKLTEIAAPDQMRFLLASQAILGRTRDWSRIVSLLTVVMVLGGLVGVTQLLAPTHHFTLSISLMLLLIIAMFVSIIVTTRQSERRLFNADREALHLTNNRDAALEALELMQKNTAPPNGSRSGQSQDALRLATRITALKNDTSFITGH